MARAYVPALLGFRFLTQLYEPVVRITMKDAAMKRRLVDQLALRDGMRLADIGCGPGSLAVRAAQACPGAEVVAVDGDPEILSVARKKAGDAGVTVRFVEGPATEPPLERATFDRVAMSLVLHHLSSVDKVRALRAAHDLLRPGGEIHVVDWGEARSRAMRIAFLSIQLLDGFANTGAHVRGELPRFLTEGGFRDVVEAHRERTIFGVVSFYRGTKLPS